MAKSQMTGMTKRIRRRKTKNSQRCRVCQVDMGPQTEQFHLDARVSELCKFHYVQRLQRIYEAAGRICVTCHFAREVEGFGGRVKCLLSKATQEHRKMMSILRQGCAKYQRKVV